MKTLAFYLKLLFSFKEIHWIPRKGDMRECTPYTLSFDGSGSSISGVSVITLVIAYDVSLINQLINSLFHVTSVLFLLHGAMHNKLFVLVLSQILTLILCIIIKTKGTLQQDIKLPS